MNRASLGRQNPLAFGAPGPSFLHLLFSNMEDTDANSPTPEEQPAVPEAAPDVTPAPSEPAEAPVPESPSSPAPAPEDSGLEPEREVTAAEMESSTEPAGAVETPAGESEDALAPLLAKAATQRLSIPEEEKAIGLIRDRLLAKKDVFMPTVELLPKLGWAVASKSVGAAWPEMKATAKNALIKILSADESEPSRRIRLSIGRSLFKVPDLPASLKLIIGVAKEIRDKETSAITAKDAQMFSNVTIGKGKPWIAQLALAEVKPADADLLIHAAIFAGFILNQPPITQIGILKWAAEAGRLERLHESAQALVVKAVGRMSNKWQSVLRKDVPELPQEIAAALKHGGAPAAEKAESLEAEAEEDDGLPAELKAEASAAESSAVASSAADGPPPAQRERPVYVSKTIPPREQRSPERTPAPAAGPERQQAKEGKGGGRSLQFNAQDALRQLETHINFIKGELKAAETKLRSREHDETRRSRQKPDVPVIPGEPTPEELARLNVQLEARITELQSRIDDLAADAEARATSAGAFAPNPETNLDQQLRTLLSLKLQEAYADFLALESQDPDIVVQQHYGTVLREVFAVLKAEGVPLAPPPEPPVLGS
jgi:hypothetical protein